MGECQWRLMSNGRLFPVCGLGRAGILGGVGSRRIRFNTLCILTIHILVPPFYALAYTRAADRLKMYLK